MAYRRRLTRKEKESRRLAYLLWVQSLALIGLGVYCIGVLHL